MHFTAYDYFHLWHALFDRTIFEYGDLTDKNYFKLKRIQPGDAVYITTADIPLFLDTFRQLPMTTRYLSWSYISSIYRTLCFTDAVCSPTDNCL